MTYPVQGNAGIPAAYLQPEQWVADAAYQGGGYWAHYGGKGTHFTEPQLERLFINAGGPALDAPVMAAIAEQIESAGWSDAWNSSGATGLWQVEFPGSSPPGMSREELFTPAGNAKAAARLDRTQGLAPWGSDQFQVTVPPLAPSKALPKGTGAATLTSSGGGGGGGGFDWNPLSWPGQIASSASGGITGTLTELAVLAPILLAAAAIAVLGLARMTQPARQRIEERVDEKAGQAAQIAAVAAL